LSSQHRTIRIPRHSEYGVTIVTRKTTTRLIAEPLKTSNNKKGSLQVWTRNEVSVLLFQEINELKWRLKPEKTANIKKRKVESILSTEIKVLI
jgi:hypothetical protein